MTTCSPRFTQGQLAAEHSLVPSSYILTWDKAGTEDNEESQANHELGSSGSENCYKFRKTN
jgi:hypothetical protein